ncbi:MAG: hypothetical protein IPH03_13735 [Tetrasphaera sp.]|nr:hypothetical protein [Tetrasphaera sp.]
MHVAVNPTILPSDLRPGREVRLNEDSQYCPDLRLRAGR